MKSDQQWQKLSMGRGDIKTKKGKIFAGLFGKSRPAKVAAKDVAPKETAPKAEKAEKPAVKKAAPKKAAAKKDAE